MLKWSTLAQEPIAFNWLHTSYWFQPYISMDNNVEPFVCLYCKSDKNSL